MSAPVDPPTADEARASLTSVKSLSRAAGRRAVMPVWWRLAFALAIGAMVAVQAMPVVPALVATVVVAALAAPLFLVARRVMGVVPRPITPPKSQPVAYLTIVFGPAMIGVVRGLSGRDGVVWIALVLGVLSALVFYVGISRIVRVYTREHGVVAAGREPSS